MRLSQIWNVSRLGFAAARVCVVFACVAVCLPSLTARSADEQEGAAAKQPLKFKYRNEEITKEKFEELWERHKDQFYWNNGQITDLSSPEGVKRLKYPFEHNDCGLVSFKIIETDKNERWVKVETEFSISVSKSISKPVPAKIYDVGEDEGKKGDKMSLVCKVLPDRGTDVTEAELVSIKKVKKIEFKKYLDEGYGLYIYEGGKKKVDR